MANKTKKIQKAENQEESKNVLLTILKGLGILLLVLLSLGIAKELIKEIK